MRFTLRVLYDGKVFIPQEPVNLPVGAVLEVTIPDAQQLPPEAAQGPGALEHLADIADQFPDDPDSPGDAAAQHDHYLYGTPKRQNP
jgi:hypothetical protein